jgi:uncharacterized protein YyaL (SSP411 family)
MKTARIIDAILATKTLEGTRIGLAAYLAKPQNGRGGFRDCIADVQEFWRKQGGTIDDRDEALAAGIVG